jgi:hypothetical protein
VATRPCSHHRASPPRNRLNQRLPAVGQWVCRPVLFGV